MDFIILFWSFIVNAHTYTYILLFLCFYLWRDDTKFQYNPKIKKKKKITKSLYQLATIVSTSYITLVFINTTMHNIMNINSR